jgi:mono/diheme cytochrome c family protein
MEHKMRHALLTTLVALVGCLVQGHACAADEDSVVRGGRLYDNWTRVSKLKAPSEPNPAFNLKLSGVAAQDTYRCVTCHGWDYKGANGFVGIRARQGSDVAAIVAVLKDAFHHYDELLRERELLDLANFVSRGQTDPKLVVEAWQHSNSPVAAFGKIFSTMCANCHGLDGSRMAEVSPLGDSARLRSFEVLHVILNGHPGRDMPALGSLGSEAGAKMLAYLQTLPGLNLAASVAHGGRLYDDWQAESGVRLPALPHPAYPRNTYYANDTSLTWRCSACHGWDYQGNQGEYASGRHATGIKGIQKMIGVEPARVYALLRDSTHRFDTVLKDRDLQDLANFVSIGQIDMDAAIDRRTRSVQGDAVKGAKYFGTLCAVCHGSEGQRMATTPIGRVIRSNPWGALHTVLNGHPDEKMPALRELDLQVAKDILSFAQGLPDNR